MSIPDALKAAVMVAFWCWLVFDGVRSGQRLKAMLLVVVAIGVCGGAVSDSLGGPEWLRTALYAAVLCCIPPLMWLSFRSYMRRSI